MPSIISAHKRGGDERLEALHERPVEGHVHECDLEAGPDAAQEVEAAAGNLGSAGHVDGAQLFAELEVIPRLKVEHRLLSDLAQGSEVLLTAGRHAVDDGVGYFARRAGEFCLGIGRNLGEVFYASSKTLSFAEQADLLLPRRLRDLLAEGFLRCPQVLRFRDRGAALQIGVDGHVDKPVGITSSALRCLENFGIVTEQLRINHPSSLLSNAVPLVTCQPRHSPQTATPPSYTTPSR